jgi:prepilin signal peptidase PulO-like enzyme (type II secretory pathway)
MIFLPIALGVICAVAVNGLADNLIREENVPLSEILIPRCSYCDAKRKVPDWSAVFSNLFLSGKCLRCGAPRAFRDLIVEAVLWIGMPAIWLAGRSGARELLLGGFLLSAFLLFTVIDFEHRYVLGEAVGLVSLVVIVDGALLGADSLGRVLLGGLAGFLVFLVLFFLGKLLARLFRIGQGAEPLGFGDVILAALVGFATGWPSILLAVFLSIFLGGAAGLILLSLSFLKGKLPVHATMAYGPYLLLAGLIVFFYGGRFLQGILDLIVLF